MRIDKTRGFAGYWVNGAFYRVTGHPDDAIKMWTKSIRTLKDVLNKNNKEIFILTDFGCPYFPAEIRIAKLEKSNAIYLRDIQHHQDLINMMKIKRPFTLHAVEMIKNGIISDDYKGE